MSDARPQSRQARFEETALPWLRPLYGFAVRLVRNPDDASDVVQESFLRAYRTFDAFVPGTNARAWLFRILISVVSNHRRRHTRQRVVAVDDVVPHFDRAALEAWRSGRGRTPAFESAALLEDALLCLPEDHRAVLLLVDVEGLTYEEAAHALDCPTGTIRSRLSRARRALFTVLSEGGPGTGYPSGREE